MSATALLRAIKKWWWTLVAFSALGVAAGFAVGLILPPVYSSTAQLVVAFNAPAQAGSSDLVQANSFAVQKAYAYTEIGRSPRVLNEVIASQGLDTTVEKLARELTVEAPLNTPILQLTAEAPTAQEAATLATAFVDAFTQTVQSIETPAGATSSPVRLETLQEPEVPDEASSPNVLTNLALGFAVGFAVALVWIALAAIGDRRVHGSASVGEGVPRVLGSIPGRGSSLTELVDAPQSRESEAYRTVAAVLGHMPHTRLDVVAVVPATPRDRASALSTNLALAMREFGVGVVLVDANLRAGTISSQLSLEGPGLAGVLSGEATVVEAVREVAGIAVLPVGRTLQNPVELMSGPGFAAVVKALSETYDMVVLDAAPALPLSDTIFAASTAGSTILAVTAGRATAPQLSAATEGLRAVGIDPVGVVVVDAKTAGVDADAATSSFRDLRPARA
ncbi:polysaccharide biosynthesis tyrosine autokinase [uncultured Microbacterium sp.]|uniref:polysaccharide biosynthesis tyrosine autokinase n=1 Tax=uncultured Microbacterium sp. TaxID=191216 RepID=UPI0025F3BFED|nr:polysaccharide biosynthesis tyrosine autokinase [uncultured Microbacterium sp.]